ncbi:hypothetical protein [Qipengyuania nanhaisediminis]|uniref:Uncharacterized protein n=1 Tax=Qipengyuania nanhaisediminis TaxID=604088 RepID=A0A1I5N4N3_9SPHN|nr:hypothetical protein [Qipengyuania nanhaisediminis]SFP16769.1 hypothetical protein SAMN04488060_1787 [Qipengyuania nanhaisediminis]
MSFFKGLADSFRAVNEGRSTAKAHQLAEQLLGVRLPPDVAQDGYTAVADMADFSSVEQMAMIYTIKYAKRQIGYLDAVNATGEFRREVAMNVARACIGLADLQRGGADFNAVYVHQLIGAAKQLGVKTDSPKISFEL